MEMEIYEEMKQIKEKVITDKWIESVSTGKAAIGLTLESLLGKEQENFELPDYKGIELKAKSSKTEFHITLFGATPDSYLFEIKRLQKEYGYPDTENPEFNIFNLSVYGNRKVKLNSHYFQLYVDRKKERITLKVYDEHQKTIDQLTEWSFEMLKEKLERKFKYLALAHADRKFQHNVVYFKFTDINFYKLTNFENFLQLVEKGIIRITFRISVYKKGKRLGQIYDHGTVLSIIEQEIPKLFDRIDI